MAPHTINMTATDRQLGKKSYVNIIDFPNLGITYNGGWCTATIAR